MLRRLDLSQLHFLVADDSRFMRRLVTSALKGFGAKHIVESATATNAYELICERRPDIALLDWEFPDKTGEWVMRSIRKPGHPSAFQTVIMMSGHDEKRRIERALRFGVNGYVAKPVAPATLYAQISQAVLNPRPYVKTDRYFGPRHALLESELATDKEEKAQASVASDAFDLDELDTL